MKKIAIISVLLSMMTLNAHAQWFDFDANSERAVLGFNCGVVGYYNVTEVINNSTWTLTDIGAGLSVSLAGIYLDCVYVMPDHLISNKVINGDWDDYSTITINAGYQFPVYENYVFITPLIGFSRVTTGITEGDSSANSLSFLHKYTAKWHRNDLNFGAGITIAPFNWFELNINMTKHAAYAAIAFNLASILD